MSVIPPENPRYEDHIVVQSMSQRDVTTRYGAKKVVDVKDDKGRDLQIWDDNAMATQLYNLAFDPSTGAPTGATVRVEYTEKPASDPQYPPNRTIKAVGPGGGATAATQPPANPQQFAPGAAAAGVTQAPSPMQQQPAPAAQPAAEIPQGGSGPSQDDKIHMRRSAAIKAAAVYSAGTGEDLWKIANEMLTFIETGADPIPF